MCYLAPNDKNTSKISTGFTVGEIDETSTLQSTPLIEHLNTVNPLKWTTYNIANPLKRTTYNIVNPPKWTTYNIVNPLKLNTWNQRQHRIDTGISTDADQE